MYALVRYTSKNTYDYVGNNTPVILLVIYTRCIFNNVKDLFCLIEILRRWLFVIKPRSMGQRNVSDY